VLHWHCKSTTAASIMHAASICIDQLHSQDLYATEASYYIATIVRINRHSCVVPQLHRSEPSVLTCLQQTTSNLLNKVRKCAWQIPGKQSFGGTSRFAANSCAYRCTTVLHCVNAFSKLHGFLCVAVCVGINMA
jgi:hypothetical protein